MELGVSALAAPAGGCPPAMTVTPAEAFAAPLAAATVAFGIPKEALSMLATDAFGAASETFPSPIPLPLPFPSFAVGEGTSSGDGVKAAFGASAGVMIGDGFAAS